MNQEHNLKTKKCIKESFAVIGKEGSTKDGEGFIGKLWMEANGHFDEIAHLVKKDDQGRLAGIWGAMSDFSRTYQPWEKNFSEGLYLAGAECEMNAEAPTGWTKWTIPGFVYLSVEKEDGSTFGKALDYIKENGLTLAGAVQEFNCPVSGREYLYFPVNQL